LDLEVPGKAGGGDERFLDLDPFEVGNGQVDLSLEIRVDDRGQRQLDFLGRESHGMPGTFGVQVRVVATEKLRSASLPSEIRIENGAEIGVQRLRAAE